VCVRERGTFVYQSEWMNGPVCVCEIVCVCVCEREREREKRGMVGRRGKREEGGEGLPSK
jgi:hypothetical protein